jgi:hypothetical protein
MLREEKIDHNIAAQEKTAFFCQNLAKNRRK